MIAITTNSSIKVNPRFARIGRLNRWCSMMVSCERVTNKDGTQDDAGECPAERPPDRHLARRAMRRGPAVASSGENSRNEHIVLICASGLQFHNAEKKSHFASQRIWFMSTRSTRIGLVFTHNWAYCREVLKGIKEFAELRPHWILTPVAPEPRAVQALARTRPAGAIVHVFNEATARAVRQLKKPYVNVSGMMREPLTPRVGNDDVACGRLAAQHLIDRGFRHFGFIGSAVHSFSICRERGFVDTIRAFHHAVNSYHEPPRQPFDLIGRMWLQHRAVGRWLASLPRPIGILAADDAWALQLTEVCRQMELRVPEDVSIIGVENDELLCNLARPPLSSVQPDARRVGIEAAQFLDRMLLGRVRPKHSLLLKPARVVERRSTDILAIDDADVAAAIRFIRENGHWPLHVRDILAQVPVSRRSLERRFRLILGRSMLEEIRRVHVERACRLLTETDFPMPTIADSSGFSDAKQLWRVFRQCVGQTPRAFRRSAARNSHHAMTNDHS
jgi:LacI family transcriptional regulator